MNSTNSIKRVWLIDDDNFYAFALKKLMHIQQFAEEIISFPHGKEALETLSISIFSQDQLPAVIFLDINMPIMDGWEFLDRFTRLNAQLKHKIRIYIMSSSINNKDLKKARSYAEVSDYLIKAITKEDLARIAEELKQTAPHHQQPHHS